MDIIHTEMADRDTATGALGLVQAYVNTVDLRDGPEQLADSNTLGGWLVANGLIGAGSGAKVYPIDVATLNEAAVVSRLRARFGADGRSRLEPEARGVAGAMGKLVAALFTAMADEDWGRLKLCHDPACRWAFYDSSRNHSSRWCKMASCGNRQKARRFRERAKSGA